MKQENRSFTIIEIIVTLVIIGVIAGLAIPAYIKMMKIEFEKDLVAQLNAFDVAQKIYKAKYSHYWIPIAKIGQQSGNVDSIEFLPDQPDDTLVKIVKEMRSIQMHMDPSWLDDLYSFRDYGNKYYFYLYNNGKLATGDIVVNDGVYVQQICCPGTKCLTVPQCVALP